MSGFYDDDTAEPPPRVPRARRPQRSRALIGTIIVLVVAFFLVSVFTGIWTDRLWFRSVGYSGVFGTVLGTKVLLFVVFGVLMGGVVGANIVLAYRFRPLFRPASSEQANLDRYREVVDPLRRWLVIGVAVVIGLFAGGSGSGQWRQYLLWRHGTPFGTRDAYFHKDVGFFIFDVPWWHYLVDFGIAVTILSLIAAAVVHYLFGGIRLQAKQDRLSGAAQVQISVLAGFFVLFKALAYWLDRYNLTTSGGLFTGIGFTDQQAVLPSKTILMFIALICAVLFFVNVLRRTWMLPSIGLALLVLSWILLGLIWPGIVQQFQVKPSEADREAPYLARNIQATRQAFGLNSTRITNFNPSQSLTRAELQKDQASLQATRLQDPALADAAFTQLQQQRGYYSVAPVLDVDRYRIDGRTRDLVIAARELDLSGIPEGQRNWTNEHTVYTHGYGMIAAYGNQRDKQDNPDPNDGKPVFAEYDLPPRGQLSNLRGGYQPRIYFGENSPGYSIVGKAPGGRNVELDLPEGKGNGASPTSNTYAGTAGVPVGGLFDKALYAIKFSDPNIVLSSRVNQNSRILYDRAPRTRVQKVAPWLTVDGDAYPAVVDGRVKWILDCYTTTDRYPNSQKDSLRSMTSDAQNANPTYATLPTDDINYMKNSVKAVVDAYDGTVKLYAWDTDPIARAWADAFPNTVIPRSQIPPDLLAHMRYPEDLFKVQRNMLAQYHVTNPRTFYYGSDKWIVPVDPENRANKQPPYRISVQLPSTGKAPVFSLTSVYTPNKRQNLASFISVDADASSKDYGTIRILRLPGDTQVPGPSQIANNFGQDPTIQGKLVAFTKANSKAIYGNLLTLPVGDGLLYVQPLFAQRVSGEGRYPALRYVLVSFGEKVGIGTTLDQALDDILGIKSSSPPPTSGGTGSGNGGTGSQGTVPSDVRTLLRQAEQKFAEARRDLQAGDLQGYAKAQNQARALVQQALRAADKASATASPSASPSGTPSSKPSASPSSKPSTTASASPSG